MRNEEHHTEIIVKPAKRLLKALLKADKNPLKEMNEHQIQAAFFCWADLNRKKHPALQFLFAIPNGGARHIAVARKLKAEGVKAGVPDVFLPFPVHPFAGLFIEFKSAKGKLTDGQKEWLETLAEYGYKTAVCYNLESAIKAVNEYIGAHRMMREVQETGTL